MAVCTGLLYLWSPLADIKILPGGEKGRPEPIRDTGKGLGIYHVEEVQGRAPQCHFNDFSFLASAFWAPYQEVTGQNV